MSKPQSQIEKNRERMTILEVSGFLGYRSPFTGISDDDEEHKSKRGV